MCHAKEIADELLPILERSLALEAELERKVLAYNLQLNNIDHELQLKKLNAPKLAKVMKYRQNILIERRDIKDQYTRIKAFNKHAQIKPALGHLRKGITENEKLYRSHTSPNYIRDTGVVDQILNDTMTVTA
jgi:hypothetical protein